MYNFATRKLEIIENKEFVFYELLVNEKSLFDKFCKEIESDCKKEKSLKSIYSLMEIFSSRTLLPKTKFRSIDKDVLYEFKKDDVRIYVIKQKPNIYVVLGGTKNTQKRDIAKFKQIAVEYLKEKQL